nr:formin-like protein 16 [Aegilops tauschii subsp. strangulata]
MVRTATAPLPHPAVTALRPRAPALAYGHCPFCLVRAHAARLNAAVPVPASPRRLSSAVTAPAVHPARARPAGTSCLVRRSHCSPALACSCVASPAPLPAGAVPLAAPSASPAALVARPRPPPPRTDARGLPTHAVVARNRTPPRRLPSSETAGRRAPPWPPARYGARTPPPPRCGSVRPSFGRRPINRHPCAR